MTWLDDLIVPEVGTGRPAHLPDPSNFGQDLLCTDDLSPNMTEVAGYPVLYQDLLHRLVTPRGTLVDDLDYGIDARDDVSRGMTDTEFQSLPQRYAAELGKNECVDTIRVDVQRGDGSSLRLSLYGSTLDGKNFRFTASVSAAGALILSS